MFYLCSMSRIHIVWFKHDLRVHDNAALNAACRAAEKDNGSVLPLYIFEPDYWRLPQHSQRQFEFIKESLRDLGDALQARGANLNVVTDHALACLSHLSRELGVTAIHTLEETGLAWTRTRTQSVQSWCHRIGISFRQQTQPGILTEHQPNAAWEDSWERDMARQRLSAPIQVPCRTMVAPEWPEWSDLGSDREPCPHRQTGGRLAAIDLLSKFVNAPAEQDGAALSAHLRHGTLSAREVWQAVQRSRRIQATGGLKSQAEKLDRFLVNLKNRYRQIQRFQDEPAYESRNLHPAYDGLRDQATLDDPRLGAWLEGETGFPYIDACMRKLHATGDLSDRQRAVVISFACHHLWLDWKAPADLLARQLTDFDPGLHYPSVQQKCGTTGLKPARIFNPIKQSWELDPDGVFIRHWLPELSDLTTEHLHEPWRAPQHILIAADITLGQTYPERMLDHDAAARQARGWIETKRVGFRRSRDHARFKPPARQSNRPAHNLRVAKGVQYAFNLDAPAHGRDRRGATH